MTKNLLLGSAVAILLAGPAMAQSTPPAASQTTPPAAQSGATSGAASSGAMERGGSAGSSTDMSTTSATSATTTAAASGTFLEKQEAGQMRADEIIGASVKNPQDEDIGKINDLVFDSDGKIVGAVVSVGGFLGMGAKDVGVNWDELQVRSSDAIVVKWTKDQLQAAPDFKTQDDIQSERDSAARSAGSPPAGGMGGGSGGMGTGGSPATPTR